MSATAESTASNTFRVMDPATEAEIARYPLMNREDVNQAVARARKAFGRWGESTFYERKQVLLNAAAALADNAGKYAEEIAAENGKTRFDAMLADVFPTAELMKYIGKNAEKFLKPVRVPGTLALPFRKAYFCFEPKGVIGVISPWNYPLSLSAGPVIQAIAAGNTVVLKPSSQTTRSGLIVKEILDRAGLPAGVVEVATGSGSVTGQALIENTDLNMLYFTGSTAIGRDVYIKAAEHIIPAVMELGGNDVAIVTRNADLDRAASGLAWSCFTNCGQTCISTELILVERSVYEPFLEKFTKIVRGLKVGKRAGEVGAMTMASQLKIVMEQLEDAKQKGAKVVAGGERPSRPGLFYPPTVLVDTNAEMVVRKEETFGPLKPVITFDSIDEAVRIANDSEYGLSGSVWTQDLTEGRRIAARIKTGSVNINDSLMTPAFPSLPFGGVKKSGIGRNHGMEGLRSFSDLKAITEFGGKMKREFFWYPIPEQMEQVMEKLMVVMFSKKTGMRFKSIFSLLPMLRRALK